MAFNIGVNVVEVDGKAAPTVVAPPLSDAGFLILAERGILNRPISVNGMVDYAANFGGYVAKAFGTHALRGFFENGGTHAYVVRVASSTSLSATVMLSDRLGAQTLLATAGSHGISDHGAWGNGPTLVIAAHPRGPSLIPAQ